MTLNVEKKFKEFESKFGFKAYEEIKDILARQHEKIKSLEKSRDNWRKKYESINNRTTK